MICLPHPVHAKATEAMAKLLDRYVPQFGRNRSHRIADVYLHGLDWPRLDR